MNYKILGAKWWTPPIPGMSIMDGVPAVCIGIVAIDSYQGNWKVYVGYGIGMQEGFDEQLVVSQGMPIGSKEAACGLFPDLDPDKFVY